MPETQLSGLVQFLETIVNPVAAALRNAPLDDEPETDEEKAAVTEAKDLASAERRQGHSSRRGHAETRIGVMEIAWTEAAWPTWPLSIRSSPRDGAELRACARREAGCP